MWRVVWFVPTLLGIFAFANMEAHSQEWGFSSPEGAVVNVVRDSSLNVSGTLALPSKAGGVDVKIPVAGRNEPGKLILEFDDPETGVGKSVTYKRGRSSDGSYTVWQADNAPEALREFRAPINVTGEPAKTALENWSVDPDAVVPVETYSKVVKTYRKSSSKATASKGKRSTVAVVTNRPGAAAWDGAASRIGADLTSVQTFQHDGVIFTMEEDDLIAALESEANLLRDFGGLASASNGGSQAVIPISAIQNFQAFTVPLANMFDTYAVENFEISKIAKEIDDLFARLHSRSLECAVGETGTGSFSVGCLHHSSSHKLRENFMVNTTFTFGVGELRDNARQLFVMSDSWAASAKQSDPTPGQDRFVHHSSDQPVVATAHDIALSTLRAELGKMFKGFRSN